MAWVVRRKRKERKGRIIFTTCDSAALDQSLMIQYLRLGRYQAFLEPEIIFGDYAMLGQTWQN